MWTWAVGVRELPWVVRLTRLSAYRSDRGTVSEPVTWHFVSQQDSGAALYQHMLMAELTETFDGLLRRVARKAIQRLVQEEGGATGLLAEIRMAARLREAIDRQITSLIASGTSDIREALLDDVLGSSYTRPTWREIGEALGVTAQAAHRKYCGKPDA